MERIETLADVGDCMGALLLLQATGLLPATAALGGLQLLGRHLRDVSVAPAEEALKRELVDAFEVIVALAKSRARMDMSDAKRLSIEILQSLSSATHAMLESTDWRPATNPSGSARVLVEMMTACANNLAAGLAPRLISNDAADALAANERAHGAA